MTTKKVRPDGGTKLSWTTVAAWRARRHNLDSRVPASAMLDVAREICGLHAQVLSSAELSLWARCEGLSRAAVRDALWGSRTLIKTWAMRGTLHLLPSRDWPLWRSAFGSYSNFMRDSWLGYFGVTRGELEKLIRTTSEVLTDTPVTRAELADTVSRAIGNPKLGAKLTQSWGMLLKPVAYQGGLCFGPYRGTQVTFVSPSAWVKPVKDRTARASWKGNSDAALQEMARRFFAAYGPASRDDFRRWWGATAKRATDLIRALEQAGELVPVNRGDNQSWMLVSQIADARNASSSGTVRLLPSFDPYVIAASPHCTGLMTGGQRAQIFRNQGWLSPVLLVDGWMAGVWRHERKGKRIIVEIAPFKRVSASTRRAGNAEAERLAEFLGGTLEVTWQ